MKQRLPKVLGKRKHDTLSPAHFKKRNGNYTGESKPTNKSRNNTKSWVTNRYGKIGCVQSSSAIHRKPVVWCIQNYGGGKEIRFVCAFYIHIFLVSFRLKAITEKESVFFAVNNSKQAFSLWFCSQQLKSLWTKSKIKFAVLWSLFETGFEEFFD